MAYSEKINTPEYKAYRTRKRILPPVITLSGTAAFTVAVAATGKLNSPRAAILIAAVFALLFALTKAKRVFDRGYDGTVTDKRLRRVTIIRPGMRSAQPADRYMLFVTDDKGRVHRTDVVETVEDTERANAGDLFQRKGAAVEYFRRGDRVRHHAGLKMYEKEDKSSDRGILCCGCLVITDKSAEKCRGCGLPLLK